MPTCDLNCGECQRDSRSRVPDLEIVNRIRAGESSMFDVLHHRHRVRIYRVAVAILVDEAEAEDAVQQAWLNAYIHLGRFEGRSSFSTWLTSIIVNEARARLRPRRLHRVDQLDETVAARRYTTAVGPEEDCLASELATRLKAGIDALPLSYRAVFDLRRNKGLSTREAANRLGLTNDVVKTRLLRATRKLRAAIEACN